MADGSVQIQGAQSTLSSFKLWALLAYLTGVALVFAIVWLASHNGSSPVAIPTQEGASVTTGPSTISPGRLSVNSVTIVAYGERRDKSEFGEGAGARALIGSIVEIGCFVSDRDNKSVRGPECTWRIVRQPGQDAFLTLKRKGDDMTAPLASLFTGSTPGLVIVSVEAYGHIAQTVVEVVLDDPR